MSRKSWTSSGSLAIESQIRSVNFRKNKHFVFRNYVYKYVSHNNTEYLRGVTFHNTWTIEYEVIMLGKSSVQTVVPSA